MLRRLTLRDFVIVQTLELDFHGGFSVLTGETGAGKSILIDALQLALGNRGDAGVVREGAARAEISAEFDTPDAVRPWLEEAGFDHTEAALLLRRTVDAQGKSRAWINGSPATVAQLREAAAWLVDIHGQHAWQGLTRPADVRALLDRQAGVDAGPMNAAWAARRQAAEALQRAERQQAELARERERLSWQLEEIDRLAPAEGEWAELSAEQQRLAHAQSLIDAAQQSLQWLSETEEHNAEALLGRALDGLGDVLAHDSAHLQPLVDTLQSAQAALRDAVHGLSAYLADAEPEPDRLAEVDARLGAWLTLARRYRRSPPDLPALRLQWRTELAALDAAADLDALRATLTRTDQAWRETARAVSALRQRAAGPLATSVTQAMQQLGMAGGRFEVALLPLDEPSPHGLEQPELRVAGHAGSTPRALAKVASGGELSRLALAIAVTTVQADPDGAATLIFDEIDAGIGGAVGDTVGALMKQLGRNRQVLAVTHLAQVAACADQHYVVAKQAQADGRTASHVAPVQGPARVAEVARMLGGERMAGTSLAHAQAMLQQTRTRPTAPDEGTPGMPAARRRASKT
ncbi:MAG: hypothetical protein RL223_1380 [Pseudomonadota bacterium]|jgi:DNA repair protein RecN (Recombination protein N)